MNRMLVLVCLCLAVCTTATQGAATPKENGEKLNTNGGTLLKGLKKLISLSKIDANVDDVKEQAISLREDTAEMAEALDDIREKLGVESSFKNENEELRAATSKMKLAVRKLKLTEDDHLQLIVGNGNINVDHRRWHLSVKLLNIIRLGWLEKELAAISTMTAVGDIQVKLDEIKTSLDSIATILGGIIDIVDDTVMTLEKLLPSGLKSKGDTDKDRREVVDNPDVIDGDDDINKSLIDSPEIDEENPPDVEPLPWPKSNKQGARQLRSFERQARRWSGSIGTDVNFGRGGWNAGVKVGIEKKFRRSTLGFHATGSFGSNGWGAGIGATWKFGK